MGRIVQAAIAAVIACASLATQASGPVVGIIEGANWDLPIVPGANFFLQSGMVQRNIKDYDASGNTTASATGGTTVTGMSRYARLFSFSALPKVGFLIEAFQPYSSIPTGGGNTVTGLGDPLVDVLVYTRPVDNLMLGLGNFVSIPVGSNEISTHAWIDLPNLVGDYKIGKFGIDGTLALGVFSQVHNGCTPANGCAVPGNLRMSEIALRYQVAPWFGPFVSYINQGESHGSFSASGVQFAGNHENDVGAGARFSISHTNWFSVWYYTGVSGQNTGKESGVYFKYVTGI